jgi:hypothetical protein
MPRVGDELDKDGGEPDHDQVVDAQADEVDQRELGELLTFATGPRFGESPQAIPGEIADDGDAHRHGVGPKQWPKERFVHQVQDAEVNDRADGAHNGELDEAHKLFAVVGVERKNGRWDGQGNHLIVPYRDVVVRSGVSCVWHKQSVILDPAIWIVNSCLIDQAQQAQHDTYLQIHPLHKQVVHHIVQTEMDQDS